MTKLAEQLAKPTIVSRCFHSYPHRPARQRTVKHQRIFTMAQTTFTALPGLLIHVRDLLETGMKITAYNHHARLLLPSYTVV
jgi:hypothetical protein